MGELIPIIFPREPGPFDVAVIVPVFGAPLYREFAETRALPSIERQTYRPVQVIQPTGSDVAAARNFGAQFAHTEWLCFLDADDELDETYLEHMSRGTADLRGPATTFHKPTGVEGPLLVPARDLEDSNYLVIGTLIRKALFDEVGGFRDWPIHEDYDLWLRCARAGASIEQIEGAVYHVHERVRSRNAKSLSYKRGIDRRIQRS